MELATINKWLRCVGLVLVVRVRNGTDPTALWIERAAAYDARCEREREAEAGGFKVPDELAQILRQDHMPAAAVRQRETVIPLDTAMPDLVRHVARELRKARPEDYVHWQLAMDEGPVVWFGGDVSPVVYLGRVDAVEARPVIRHSMIGMHKALLREVEVEC